MYILYKCLHFSAACIQIWENEMSGLIFLLHKQQTTCDIWDLFYKSNVRSSHKSTVNTAGFSFKNGGRKKGAKKLSYDWVEVNIHLVLSEHLIRTAYQNSLSEKLIRTAYQNSLSEKLIRTAYQTEQLITTAYRNTGLSEQLIRTAYQNSLSEQLITRLDYVTIETSQSI